MFGFLNRWNQMDWYRKGIWEVWKKSRSRRWEVCHLFLKVCPNAYKCDHGMPTSKTIRTCLYNMKNLSSVCITFPSQIRTLTNKNKLKKTKNKKKTSTSQTSQHFIISKNKQTTNCKQLYIQQSTPTESNKTNSSFKNPQIQQIRSTIKTKLQTTKNLKFKISTIQKQTKIQKIRTFLYDMFQTTKS